METTPITVKTARIMCYNLSSADVAKKINNIMETLFNENIEPAIYNHVILSYNNDYEEEYFSDSNECALHKAYATTIVHFMNGW